ncbi:MFS transporter [Kineosporia rhizophila]|uniref:MFS transporter n=1 Tax=Kineosporia rhizophila TaxID=84633 RepID=UPI001E33EDF5|nr:MFS transporter [Kineosporia rhizophila]
MTISQQVSPVSPPLSTRRRWTVLAVCATAMFLIGLDTTIVNVALPDIGRDLRTDTRGLQWTVDAYTIVFAGLLITSGSLADRYGRRRVFRTGLVIFGAASLACALAPSLEVLIAARALQGVGASMLSPVALAIVVNAMPEPRERARAIGIWASVFGLSMATGPVLGGALTTALGWRAVFWAGVPIVLAALLLVALVVPESRGHRHRRLDLPGQVLLMTSIGLGVGLLIEMPRLHHATAGLIAGPLLLAVLVLAFVQVETRRPQPLMDPALFRRPAFAGAVVGAAAVFVALNMTLFLNTLYLQETLGWSAARAGAATLPLAVGATICAPIAGTLMGRRGPRMPLLLAGGFLAVGGLGLLLAGDREGTGWALLALALVGIGIGFANAPLTTTAVTGLPKERAGVAGGTTSAARQVGAAIGIAVGGSLVADVDAAGLAAASRPGWIIVSGCGLVLVAVAALSAQSPGRSGRGDE